MRPRRPYIATNPRLPALPFPVGATVAVLSDSLGANATQGLNGFTFTTVRAAFDWLGYTLGRLRNLNANTWTDATDALNGFVGSNFGRGQQGFGPNGGGARPGINSYIPDLLSRGPSVIIYAGGTNNIISKDDAQPGSPNDAAYLGANFNYIQGKIREGLAAFRRAGVPTIVATIPISGTYVANGVADQLRRRVNAWIMSLNSPIGGVRSWDRAAPYEKADGTIDPDCFQGDQIHNSTYGAWKCSLSLDPILSDLIAAGDMFAALRAGVSLLPAQPGLPGEAGAIGSATTVSGKVATGCSLATSDTTNASRVVASKEDIGAGPAQKQVMAISPNGAANTLTFLCQALPPALVAGDWYQVLAEGEDDSLGRWSQMQLQANVTTGSSTVRCSSAAFQNFSADQARLKGPAFGAPASPMLLVGNPAQVPTGVAIDRLRASFIVSWPASADPFTVKVSGLGAFKVTDPRPVWRY